MVTKTIEKTVVITRDGTPLSVMERPGGLGSIEEYHHDLEAVRIKYGHLLRSLSLDEYLDERHSEAKRESEK